MVDADSPDYTQLIDAEIRAFIDRTEQWYPADTIDFSIERQREIYDSMCREFYQGYPDGVQPVDSSIKCGSHTIGLRWYKNTNTNSSPTALVVYFHGGGFVVGGLDSHDDICAEICQRTGFDVVSVDYRLSPEHRHPAAFQDALTAVRFLSGSVSLPLVLCGDSAGGNLAAAVTHAVREDDLQLAGQLLIYPSLGADMLKGSYVTHANAPLLTTRDIGLYLTIRQGEPVIDNDPSFAPLLDNCFDGLPPTVVFSAECDPLSDDSELYANAVLAAGGEAHWIREEGLVHGYLRARSTATRARDSFTRIIDNIKMLGNRDWRYKK